MAKILLLSGGNSSERDVSLRSGQAVRAALESRSHQVNALDPAEPIADSAFDGYDAIFPVLHGSGGEDGTLQARLESLGHHNFVGSDSHASELCFDKWRFRERMQAQGMPVARGAMVTAEDLRTHPLTQHPFVVKPVNAGSSVDTFIVRDISTLDFEPLVEACARYGEMLLEQLIEGIEITVGVLGDQALTVIEIIPPSDGEFDYENKYNGKTQELCPPQHISEDIQRRAQRLAEQIHRLCDCRDFSRTDMMVRENGTLVVLETNTIPGMTDQSLLPKAAAASGIPMDELCDRLVGFAAGRL